MANVIDQVMNENYAVYHADTVEMAAGLPDDSVHFSIFSPPFSRCTLTATATGTWATAKTAGSSGSSIYT